MSSHRSHQLGYRLIVHNHDRNSRTRVPHQSITIVSPLVRPTGRPPHVCSQLRYPHSLGPNLTAKSGARTPTRLPQGVLLLSSTVCWTRPWDQLLLAVGHAGTPARCASQCTSRRSPRTLPVSTARVLLGRAVKNCPPGSKRLRTCGRHPEKAGARPSPIDRFHTPRQVKERMGTHRQGFPDCLRARHRGAKAVGRR